MGCTLATLSRGDILAWSCFMATAGERAAMDAKSLPMIFANVRFWRTPRPLGLTLKETPPTADECGGIVIATFGRMRRA